MEPPAVSTADAKSAPFRLPARGGEQPGEHVGETFLARRIEGASGRQRQAERDDRLLVLLNHDQSQSVREQDFLRRWKRGRPQRGGGERASGRRLQCQ